MLRQQREDALKEYYGHTTHVHPINPDWNRACADDTVLDYRVADAHLKPGSSGSAHVLLQDLAESNKRRRLGEEAVDKDVIMSSSSSSSSPPSSFIEVKEVRTDESYLGEKNDYIANEAYDAFANPVHGAPPPNSELDVAELQFDRMNLTDDTSNYWLGAMDAHSKLWKKEALQLAISRRIRRTAQVEFKQAILDVTCQGDLILAKINAMLDSWENYPRTQDQRRFHDAFIKANLPKVSHDTIPPKLLWLFKFFLFCV
jgi:hypothetical protein